jgi:hypothetical protein
MAVCSVSCELTEELDGMRNRIKTQLNNEGVYERHNLPPNTNLDNVKGYYDIIDGAYRHITNETRPSRVSSPPIKEGDRISFYFDARIYSGSFDRCVVFYTNIENVMREKVAGENQAILENDTPIWPTEPLQITLGDDPGILKHIQTALIGCRADNGDPTDDGDGLSNGITSDRVRIYLPYNIAFGNTWVGIVPPRSTLVYEISGIQIIR